MHGVGTEDGRQNVHLNLPERDWKRMDNMTIHLVGSVSGNATPKFIPCGPPVTAWLFLSIYSSALVASTSTLFVLLACNANNALWRLQFCLQMPFVFALSARFPSVPELNCAKGSLLLLH